MSSDHIAELEWKGRLESLLEEIATNTRPAGEIAKDDPLFLVVFASIFNSNDGETVADAAAELGIFAADYKAAVHWPILAARRACATVAAIRAEIAKAGGGA